MPHRLGIGSDARWPLASALAAQAPPLRTFPITGMAAPVAATKPSAVMNKATFTISARDEHDRRRPRSGG